MPRDVWNTRSIAALAAAWAVVACPMAVAQQTFTLDDEAGFVLVEPPDPSSPEGRLQAARTALAEDRLKDALQIVNAFIDNNPNSPFVIDARLIRGDIRVAEKSYYQALFDYEYVARTSPASEAWLIALEREFEIARVFVNGGKRKFLGLRLIPAKSEGEELLIRIQERVPGSELGEKASILLADYFFDDGDMFQASEAYDLFLLNYPTSPQREWAMLRLIQANLARFRGPEYDATGLIEAGQRLAQYQAEFPASAERIGVDALDIRIADAMADKDLADARWYERRGNDVSAAYLYRRVVEDHPQSTAAQVAIARLAKLPVPVVEKTALIPLSASDAPVRRSEGQGVGQLRRQDTDDRAQQQAREEFIQRLRNLESNPDGSGGLDPTGAPEVFPR
ncbi:MAG: outer membrane protein assembly factor BamD [Planctomycetota bacterium]